MPQADPPRSRSARDTEPVDQTDFLQRGGTDGGDIEDWLAAERELSSELLAERIVRLAAPVWCRRNPLTEGRLDAVATDDRLVVQGEDVAPEIHCHLARCHAGGARQVGVCDAV